MGKMQVAAYLVVLMFTWSKEVLKQTKLPFYLAQQKYSSMNYAPSKLAQLRWCSR
jgi:hypothetical protein